MKRFLFITLVFIALSAGAQTRALPDSFYTIFRNKGLDKKFELSSFIKPAFIQADFNGDGLNDIAALIMEKATKKKGILVVHGKTKEHFLFGAGKDFGNGSDNFNWLKVWGVYNKKIAHETQFDKESGDILGSREVRLKRPALNVEDIDAGAGGLIYWNGKKYIWIHQGE